MPTADYARRVETNMAGIENSDEIHPDNKELLAEFKRDQQLDGMSDARLQKITSHLRVIAKHLGDRRLADLDKDGVKDLVEWVHNRDIAETTQADYKKVIKQFYKWHGDGADDYPENVDWITTTGPADNGTLPKDLLTREDIDALKDACRNARDRAFIAMLYETGARIGELIDLTVGDLEDHKHGRKVVIEGKTGQRRLPLVESSPALAKWLNEHPSGQASDPLWCQLQDAGSELSYNYVRQKLLERAKDRAGLDKPVNPHHFRHSRATELAQKFKEAQLCEWFGWVQGSDVPGKYVHLSGRDIDDAYFKEQGLQSEEEEEDDDPVVECWRCGELNERRDNFCSRCASALTEDAKEESDMKKAELQDEREDADDIDMIRFLDKLERLQDENPELLAAIEDL